MNIEYRAAIAYAAKLEDDLSALQDEHDDACAAKYFYLSLIAKNKDRVLRDAIRGVDTSKRNPDLTVSQKEGAIEYFEEYWTEDYPE